MNNKASLQEKVIRLCLCYILFMIVYNFSSWYASNSGTANSFIFNFEYDIPFLPWMIIPYMTSGLIFALVFLLCSYQNELNLLTKRICFITIVSGVFFALFPLKFSFVKPEVDSPILIFFYQFLNTWDTNYNQAPSLHISYACIFWSVLRQELSCKWKMSAGIWLLLMGISTLTIYQHHFIDIIAALLLICTTFFIYPDSKDKNYKIGLIYFTSSILSGLVALLIYQYISSYGLLILWISLVLFLVGCAYFRSDARFLKRKNGTIHCINKFIYFPYILTYKIMRHLFCKNRKQPITEIYPQLFIGAILNSAQARNFNIDSRTIVIDLSAEIEENKIIRQKSTYYSFPILDVGLASESDIKSILSTVIKLYENIKPDERIYIHCLMGYSRSVLIATLFIKKKLNIETKEAIALIEKKYKHAVFPKYNLD